jgi:hypothetical protein
MPEYVRVKDKSTGHHYTVMAQEVEANPDAYTVLKQPAVNELGDPLPGEIPAESTGGQSADKKKES